MTTRASCLPSNRSRRHLLTWATLLGFGLAPLTSALAYHPYHPPGSSLGFGDATRYDQLQSSKRNPAGPISASNRGVRMGILGIGVGAELGKVDDFADDFEQLGDDFDKLEGFDERIRDFEDTITTLKDTPGPNSEDELRDALESLDQDIKDLQDLEIAVNDLLNLLGERGYLAIGVTGNHAPFPLEVTHDALRGSVTVDLEYGFRGHVSVLHGAELATGLRDIDFSTDPEDYLENGELNTEKLDTLLDTDLKLDDDAIEKQLEQFGGYIRGIQTRTLSIGYGTAVYTHPQGILFAGGRLNHHQVELSRVVVSFDDDAGDTLSDEWDSNSRERSAFGVDAGVMWVGDGYRAGATARNLNSPSFKYPQVRDNETYDRATARGEIDTGASYTMEPQLTVEGAVSLGEDERWLVGAALDLNEIEGPFADNSENAYQWATIGASYHHPRFYIPSARLGYRKNLAGTELGYISGGLTLFNLFNLDLAVATERVDSVPRGFFANLGFETAF
ncbi:conjugal transfer protein TraF [Halorhodospira abdelmalekii]|uniref:conjugal transfer protein TraF n=1 Tax=Halorhodospira abdelmalekii TaxID=421629 RepID=UPI0019089B08|nr:conjugal transfer protein TraF [Halorhodospira abdelmalekii]